MTHTHNNIGSGRPPLAVWPCAPTTHQPPAPAQGRVPVPRRLALRLVEEYTPPGAVVADLTGTGLVAEQAAVAGRFHEVADSTFPEQSGPQEEEVAWADLTTLAFPATSEKDQRSHERRLWAQVVFAATVTLPGGVIAVITSLAHTTQGVVIDPAPGLVRAATRAGLVYLQHVVAITAPICEAELGTNLAVGGTGFDPDQEEVEAGAGLPVLVADAAASITWPAHLNVSIFLCPKKARTVTTAREVGA